MKTKLLTIFLSLSVAFSLMTEASAAVTPGATCSKAGVKQVYKGKTHTCIKSGKKLVWDKGVVKATSTPTTKPSIASTPTPTPTQTPTQTPTPTHSSLCAQNTTVNPFYDCSGIVCIPGSYCPIGSSGPGGGIVFYDAGSQQSWGRYLEVAPKGWSVSASASGVTTGRVAEWCNVSGSVNGSIEVKGQATAILGSVEIGKGKANTNLMVAFCSSGAGVEARAYKGGGKSDWFLPSKDELNELCKFASYQPTGFSEPRWIDARCEFDRYERVGFEVGDYWSSSEQYSYAWSINFLSGGASNNTKNTLLYVRPIRAF